ncbi:MAG: adenosine deaminase [Pyrinomonadaceae bacterium]
MKRLNLETLPKTELHLHLEGAIPADVLLELVHKYGGAEEAPDKGRLAERLTYRDFPHFLDTWRWMCRFVREYEDFTRMAYGVAKNLAAQHVRYAELHFSPPDFLGHGLSVAGIAKAVRAGLDQAGGLEVSLIMDLCRQYGPERGRRWLGEVVEVADEAGIVGVGLGGPEHLAPAGPYSEVFRLAESHGLHRVAHAGEAAGPESIWAALNELGAERIGHGTLAVMDEELMRHLRDTGIPLETCPTSNVCTGVVEGIERHPVRRLFDAGVRITLSSDDPTFFGTNIVSEYQLLREHFGFSDEELARVARNGFEVAFLPEERRAALLRGFDEYCAKELAKV